jgi:hypothetical protein
MRLYEISSDAHQKGEALGDFFNADVLAESKKREEETAVQIESWIQEVAEFIRLFIGEQEGKKFPEMWPTVQMGLEHKYRLVLTPPGETKTRTLHYWTLHDVIEVRMTRLRDIMKQQG